VLRRVLLRRRVLLLRRVGAAIRNDDDGVVALSIIDAIRVRPRSNRLRQSHAQALVAATGGTSQPVGAVVRGEYAQQRTQWAMQMPMRMRRTNAE
jgi:hypothetical protein